MLFKVCSIWILLPLLIQSSTSAQKEDFQNSGDQEGRLTMFEKELAKISRKTSNLEAEVSYLRAENKELNAKVEVLSVENQELKSAKATLEERVEYLEAITRSNVPRTCQDLKNLGVPKSGTYLIDPDGPGLGDAPISVFCDMAAGTTIVTHDQDGQSVEVEHCEDPGCHSTIVQYDATARQLKALVGLSQECTQEFRYDCFVAPMIENGNINMAWWVGAGGQPNYYWDGSHDPSTHTCACGQDGSCINENYLCNCDSGFPQWLTDAGTFSKMTSLPVTELRFGGLVVDGQQATFGVGPLACRGRKEFRASDSCESLRLAGHTSSGYYMVDGQNGLGYNLVLCDMDRETDDQGLETPTAMKLPEYQVSFDATDPVTGTAPGQVITYGTVLTNQGNALNPETGTFVAPFHGVYSFSFFTLDELSATQSRFLLLVNGDVKGMIENTKPGCGSDWSTTAMTLVLELFANDTVNIYLDVGGLFGGTYSHFTGTLLYPL